MQTIAIIGAGNVGRALGASLTAAGHDVVYGVRSPDTADLEGARVVGIGEAAAGADVVILAVPSSSIETVAGQLGAVSGRILVDASNPVQPDGSGLATAAGDSAGQRLAALVPAARVVKAFNTTGAGNLADSRYPDGPLVMPICGDDDAAKEIVSGLAEDIGFAPLDVGGIALADRLESFAMLWIGLAYGKGLGTNFGFRLVRR